MSQITGARRHISKRNLGEGYIVGTGVVLAAILGGQILKEGSAGLFWVVSSGVSFGVLIGAFYWLRQLDLDAEGVWLVSNCSALGLGVGTAALLVVDVATTTALVTGTGTAVLGTTLAATAVTGALGGVAVVLHHSNRKLRGQNAVLHRILRHNLRNDMSVVLCHLDDIEESTNGETAKTARRASEKIRSVVRLTDSVRQANVSLTDPEAQRQRHDVTAIVKSRVQELETEHPDFAIGLDLPDEAFVVVSPQFGLVVDNIVESAHTGETGAPQLTVRVEKSRETVTLVFEDHRKAISEADLSAVATGSETALEHGLGVELWLVEWLVDANGGEVFFEADDDSHRVSVELERARVNWLG